jgi:MarR family transcriptional regulator, transcriptional regulator for hemolysin
MTELISLNIITIDIIFKGINSAEQAFTSTMDRLRTFGFLIKDLSRLYTRRFEEYAGEMGVTLAQCKALVHLSKNEGVSQVRLAELSDIEPMTLVRILDRMEADDWIERRPDPADRRARQLYLRPKASPALDRIWKIGERIRGEMFSDFSERERQQLLLLLERAHAGLVERGQMTTGQVGKSVGKRAAAAKKNIPPSTKRKAVRQSR